MASRLIKTFDPADQQRQVHLVIKEHQAPGLLEFLTLKIPYGLEGAWWRGIARQWIDQNVGTPDFEARIAAALTAGGVEIERGQMRPRRRAARTAA